LSAEKISALRDALRNLDVLKRVTDHDQGPPDLVVISTAMIMVNGVKESFAYFGGTSMITEPLSVACIGLGRMGSGIAHNIQRHGFPLMVYNRTVEKTKPFVAASAPAAASRGVLAALAPADRVEQ
jgi:glutamyl-tRNA reductase